MESYVTTEKWSTKDLLLNTHFIRKLKWDLTQV